MCILEVNWDQVDLGTSGFILELCFVVFIVLNKAKKKKKKNVLDCGSNTNKVFKSRGAKILLFQRKDRFARLGCLFA